MNWTQTLMEWFYKNKRDFIWRSTKDPYRIWISEIMLQQTRASQGQTYYKKFIGIFPDLQTLALANQDKVLKLWQGLGYYSRAINLHSTARYLYNEYEGKFPKTFNEIINLKGIGDYTASAIASICFDIPEAVVDGNVYRFLSRFFGISIPINTSNAHREFKKKATELMDFNNPGDFNQAIMEFGSIQCKPKNPLCLKCPFNDNCVAYKNQKIDLFPVKKKNSRLKNRYFNYFVFQNGEKKTIVEKRNENDIWKNLFQFPLLELPKLNYKKDELLNQIRLKYNHKIKFENLQLWNSKPIIQKLSHQKLHIFFWIINLKKWNTKNWTTVDDLKKLPIPIALQNFIDNFYN